MTARNHRDADEVRVVTSGSTIRIESPKSGRKSKPRVSVIDASDEFVGGFVDFLRDNAVVGLAIGFVIGLQAQTLVKQLVTSFIDPAFALLFGQALSQRDVAIAFNDRTASFTWGAFAHVLINFLFVLAAIYLIYRLFKLDKLEKKKPEKKDIDKMKELK